MSEQEKSNKSRPGGVPATPGSSRLNQRLIDNVAVNLEAFLGDARMTVAELMSLTADSVVPLGASLVQSVELRLNGVTVAKGELVAVGQNFGVRLTEISQ